MEEPLLLVYLFFLLYFIIGTIVSRTKFFKKWYLEFAYRDIYVVKNIYVPKGVESKEWKEYEFRANFSFLFLILCLPQILLMRFYDIIKYLIEKRKQRK